MITNTKSLPKLRFPEFNDEWRNVKLGDIAQFSKGANISKNDIAEDGAIEAIRYGELYTTYSEIINTVVSKTNLPRKSLVFSQSNDVIIPASGESNIDIATASTVLKDGVALSGDINIIRSNNNGVFLAYYLNNAKKTDIAKLAQGISVVHLYSSSLSLLNLNLPTIPEQTKIAGFLTIVDERIATIEQKVELLKKYKKAVMQKIFTQQIRFKDKSGQNYPDWEEKKLSYFLTIPTKKKTIDIDKNKILTVKLHNKGVSKSTNTQTLSIGSTNYYARKSGQLIYGKQNLFNGAIGIVPSSLDGFLSSGDVPALNIKDSCSSKFLILMLSRKEFYKQLEKYASGTGSKRIHENTLLKIEISTPEVNEQMKIADFLTLVDEKIEVEERQLASAKEFKKALLQQMFA